MTPVRLEPVIPGYRVKQSTTEPLCSQPNSNLTDHFFLSLYKSQWAIISGIGLSGSDSEDKESNLLWVSREAVVSNKDH